MSKSWKWHGGAKGGVTIYMHCLPALHDGSTKFEAEYPGVQDVDDAVIEGPQSRVFELAENRMHTAKALMVATMA